MDLENESLHSDCRIVAVYKKKFRRRKSDGVEGVFCPSLIPMIGLMYLQLHIRTEVGTRSANFDTEPANFLPELPGGVIEKGEDPIVAGLRELESDGNRICWYKCSID